VGPSPACVLSIDLGLESYRKTNVCDMNHGLQGFIMAALQMSVLIREPGHRSVPQFPDPSKRDGAGTSFLGLLR
jgi:hypothetical protein